MNYQKVKKSVPPHKGKQVPFECVALVLQGGGALGSYQGGVYEALAEIDLHPNWIAGISIGAINAAIIAGNPPKERVSQLRAFWESITANLFLDWMSASNLVPQGDWARGFFNQMSAGFVVSGGAAGFFEPRTIPPYFQPDGSVAATSFYNTSMLKATLEKFADFDRINNDGMRLSVGAVNVRTGNFVYFDTNETAIRPEHIIASGSLPPGFPATEIDGEFYWDGGLVSNTPLQWVVDGETRQDTLAFQVDLWPAKGDLPRNMMEVTNRQKEIQYSSRTRAATDSFKRRQRTRNALALLMPELPEALRDDSRFDVLKTVADHKVYNLVHLIYRARTYEGNSKDFDFSRVAMLEHWQSGLEDARVSLAHKEIFNRPGCDDDGVLVFDFTKEEGGQLEREDVKNAVKNP